MWLYKSKTIEENVLYHATVVSRCTGKAMSLSTAVLCDVLWVTSLSKTYSMFEGPELQHSGTGVLFRLGLT